MGRLPFNFGLVVKLLVVALGDKRRKCVLAQGKKRDGIVERARTVVELEERTYARIVERTRKTAGSEDSRLKETERKERKRDQRER